MSRVRVQGVPQGSRTGLGGASRFKVRAQGIHIVSLLGRT